MKYLYVSILFLSMMACHPNKIETPDIDETEIPDIDESIVACGVHQPQKNLPWLKELVKKAENDRTGQCLGTIWLVRYKEMDIFVTNMGFGSGGVLYWFLDCSGNHLDGGGGDPSAYIGSGLFSVEDPKDLGLFVLSLRLYENKDVPVIYSNIPL